MKGFFCFQFNPWFLICIYNMFWFGHFSFNFLFPLPFVKVFITFSFILQIKFMIFFVFSMIIIRTSIRSLFFWFLIVFLGFFVKVFIVFDYILQIKLKVFTFLIIIIIITTTTIMLVMKIVMIIVIIVVVVVKVVKNAFLTRHGRCKLKSNHKIIRNFLYIYNSRLQAP